MSTPLFGFPYPLGNSKVRDGDDAIAALALQVEEQLSGTGGVVPSSPYRSQAGSASFPSAPIADTGLSINITYAAGRFTQVPHVQLAVGSTGYGVPTCAGHTLTGFSARYYNPTASTPSVPTCWWWAYQMSPTATPGMAFPAPTGVQYTATCLTADCPNSTIPIETWWDSPDGQEPYVVCGVCSQPITPAALVRV